MDGPVEIDVAEEARSSRRVKRPRAEPNDNHVDEKQHRISSTFVPVAFPRGSTLYARYHDLYRCYLPTIKQPAINKTQALSIHGAVVGSRESFCILNLIGQKVAADRHRSSTGRGATANPCSVWHDFALLGPIDRYLRKERAIVFCFRQQTAGFLARTNGRSPRCGNKRTRKKNTSIKR